MTACQLMLQLVTSIVFPYLSCEFKVQLVSDLYVAGVYIKGGEHQSQALPPHTVLASYG